MQITDSVKIIDLIKSINDSYNKHEIKAWGEKLQRIPPGNANLAKKIREGNVMLLTEIEEKCAALEIKDFKEYTMLTHLYALAPTLVKEIDMLDKIIKE